MIGRGLASAGALTRRSRPAFQQIVDFIGHAVGSHSKRLVDMNVALCNAARGVPEQRRDRQFRKAKLTGKLAKVWRNV
ncbi:hypothetical protein VSX64_24330 [Aurantimonas sp. C2-6-R+9]|nr:hypothetical protein [Aurantimonas sp. C2-6-R+9]